MNIIEALARSVAKADETTFLGPVDGFQSVPAVVGKGPSRRVEAHNVGLTGIKFREGLPADRPAFACRGTRYARVKGVGVKGFAVRDNSFPMTDERYWGPDNQHSFFEVNDKTVGTEDPSSDNGFEDVWVGRFCQLLSNGADIHTNGDFTFGRDVNCEDLKYLARSLGGQARSMLLERWTAANVWTCFSNVDPDDNEHGQFGGKIETLSIGGFIGRIFEFTGTSVLGPIQFDCLKAESLYRIGDWVGNTASEGSLVFDSANLQFLPIKTMEYGVPANVMGGNNQSAITFNATDFGGTTVLSMMPADVRLQQGSKFHTILGISEPWQKAAWNASLGVYAGSTQHDVKATLYGDTNVHNVSTGEYRHGHIALPYWVERARFPGTSIEISHSRPVFSRLKSDFETTVDGLDVTLKLADGIGIPTPRAVGFYQGGAVRCDVTGQILWIKGVIGRTVYAEAMSGHDFTTATVSGAGSWQFIAGGYKTPKAPLWGKFTTGSATVSIEGSTDGLKVGDLLSVHQYGRGDFGADPRIKEIHADRIELEAPVGVSGEFPLFVWIEEIEMQMGLGMGVSQSTGAATGDHFNDTFDSDTESWAIQAGSPTLTWVADDSASHAAGGYTGCLRYATDGAGDNIVSKSFTVPRNTLMRVDLVCSFGASGDRFTPLFKDGGGASVSTTLIAGNSTSPFTTAQTVTFELTTPDTANGETLKIELYDFPPADVFFFDQIRAYAP